jgi:hypothetical protein
MAFTAITTTEVDVDSPVSDELMEKVKDNFDDLNSRVSSPLGIPNGDLEIDGDSDGIPDGFTRSLYAGGSAAFDTTTPYRGAQAYKFTRASGAGNGGGYLETGYLTISEYLSFAVRFALKCSVAGIKVKVTARYFDKSKVDLSADEDIYSSTSNPTSWTAKLRWGQPPANARYVKLRYIGGYTDTDVAGDVYFDDLDYDPAPMVLNEQVTITEGATAGVSWADRNSVAINIPKGFVEMLATLQYKSADAGVKTSARFRISTTYSGAAPFTPGAEYQEARLEMDVSALAGAQTLYIQVIADTVGVLAYGKKPTGNIQYVRGRA